MIKIKTLIHWLIKISIVTIVVSVANSYTDSKDLDEFLWYMAGAVNTMLLICYDKILKEYRKYKEEK